MEIPIFGRIGTKHAAHEGMIATLLMIYFGVGILFVLGVSLAAKRPMPHMQQHKVCDLPQTNVGREYLAKGQRDAA